MTQEKTGYARKLADPRWQKKRLEILKRDRFKCRLCKYDDVELHVHHLSYEKGKNPHECLNSNLVTLCQRCHNIISNTEIKFENIISLDVIRNENTQFYVIVFYSENDTVAYFITYSLSSDDFKIPLAFCGDSIIKIRKVLNRVKLDKNV